MDMAGVEQSTGRTYASSCRNSFNLIPVDGKLYKLEFSGPMPIDWAKMLTAGLSARRINIISGVADRVTQSSWAGEFLVDFMQGSARPESLSLTDLLWPGSMGATSTPKLSSFSVGLCYKGNGSLFVKVEGNDQMGFLAGMLDRFASCSLFPRSLVIQTHGAKVHDQFHLMGPAGILPSKWMQARLVETLGAMVP